MGNTSVNQIIRMSYWICDRCGAKHEEKVTECKRCGHEEFHTEEDDPEEERIESGDDLMWECKECGERHQKNNPPCNNCGGLQFEAIYIEEERDGEPTEDTSPEPFSSSTTQITGTKISIYLIGVLTSFIGLLYLLSGDLGFGGPPFVAGLLVLPIFRKQLYYRFNIKFTGGAVALTWILAWMLAILLYSW